jgi:hypothetical protein
MALFEMSVKLQIFKTHISGRVLRHLKPRSRTELKPRLNLGVGD